MKKYRNGRLRGRAGLFDRMAGAVTHAAGRPTTFFLALVSIVVWGACGPLFGYSETWQLVINTSTTIVTFMMVFVIQHSQNKDSIALHLKLNELIASHATASNRLIAVECLAEEELDVLVRYYERLAELTRSQERVHESHSLDGAAVVHEHKKRRRRRSVLAS